MIPSQNWIRRSYSCLPQLFAFHDLNCTNENSDEMPVNGTEEEIASCNLRQTQTNRRNVDEAEVAKTNMKVTATEKTSARNS